MKNIYCFLIILFQTIFLFSQERETLFKIDSIQCVVIKIDSIENFYLIDIQSNEDIYKIISRKMCNTCSNLHIGKMYQLSLYAMFPPTLNFLDQRYHIGGNVFIEIDWGNNLYHAQELCGLCYETDPIKIKKCKRLINQQDAFENAMLYIYFHYDIKKNKHITFIDFIEKQKVNSIHFTLTKPKSIPVYASPEATDINWELFVDTVKQKNFNGKVLYRYRNFFFIQGYYACDDEVEIIGWIDKKYFPVIKKNDNNSEK